MAGTNVPVTLQFKANVDPAVQRTFQAIQALAQVAGKSAGDATSSFDQLAKEFEQISEATIKARQSMSEVGKAAKAAAAERSSAAKTAAADILAAEKQAAAATKLAESEKAEARRKAASELKGHLEYEERQRKAGIAAAQQEAKAAQQAANEKAAASKKSAEAAKEAADAFKEVEEGLQGIGTGAAAGLTALSGGLVAIAVKAAQTAREFETMSATLKTLTGSQSGADEKFSNAKSFAAATPFDVKEVVAATVQIETYGQRSEEVLPLVASLAAGMGKELKDTALVVGKAMSGSLEGFESLRNEYGITTRELVKYGAVANKTGGIMLQTASQTDKAREALSQIIKLKFGEALADRAKTVSAAMSNASDEVINFAADVGEGVAPFIKLGAVITGKFFSALQAMPTVMKAGLGASIVLGAGVTGLGAVAIATTLTIFRLDIELKKLAASNLAAAAATELNAVQQGKLAVSSAFANRGISGLDKLASGFGRLGSFVTQNAGKIKLWGGVLAGATAAAGIGTIAINSWANANEDAGRKVAETSKKLIDQVSTARKLSALLQELGGESVTAAVGQQNLGDRSRALAEAIKKIPIDQLTKKLKGLGLGPEEMKKTLEAVQAQATGVKAELQDLLDKRAELGASAISNIKDQGIDGSPIGPLKEKLDEVDAKILETTNTLKVLGSAAAIFKPVQNATESAAVAFDKLALSSQKALDFSKYADQVGGIDATKAALSELQAQIDANKGTLGAKGFAGDKQGVLSALQGGVEDESQKKALEAQLDLYTALEKGEKAVADAASDAGKKRLADLEQNLAKEQALREVSRDEELTALDAQIKQAQSLGEAGQSDYIRLLEERKTRKASWVKEDLALTKAAFESQLSASESFIEKLNAQNAPQGEVIAAYDRVIAKVKEWKAEHGPLLAANKELAQQLTDTEAKLGNGKAAASAKLLDDNLKALKASLKAIGDEAITNQEKLEAVDRQIALAKTAQASSSYAVGQADKILTELGRERLALEQTITAQKLRQAGKENQLQIESIRQEIELLQIQRDMGLAVDDQLIAKSAELREARIKDLELTYQAERETADDKLAVDREYQLARRNLEQEFTLDQQREASKRVEAVKGEAKGKETTSDPAPRRSRRTSEDTGNSDDAEGSSSAVTFSPIIFGQGPQLRERRAEKEAARHEAFNRANPEALQKVAAIDRQRAEERATRESDRLRARGKGNPFDVFAPGGQAGAQPFTLPPVPELYRNASPKKLLQEASNKNEASKAGAKMPSTVNNSQTNSVTVNVGSRTGKTVAVSTKEDAVREVRKAMDTDAFFTGGAGSTGLSR